MGTSCENTPGGYLCECAGGMWFNGSECVPGGSQTLGVNYNGAVALAQTGDLRRWGGYPDQAFLGPQGSGTPWTIDTSGGWAQLGHHCGTKGDGTLWCWDGAYGIDTASPSQIDGATDWAFVDGVSSHICAVKDGGTLWCWGRNDDGQLGDMGAMDPTLTPTQVGADTDWATVAVGDETTCAIKTDGQVWCWGATQVFNEPGSWVPVALQAPVEMSFARALVDGFSFVVEARGVDGHLYRWDALDATPETIGNDDDWGLASVGSDHRCAIKGDGSLWCWGRLLASQDTPVNTDAPTQQGSDHDWVEVSTHVMGGTSGATCARKASGEVYCFGHNMRGELGNGTIGSRTMADDVVDPGGTFEQVAANIRQTCGVRSDGTLACWGGVDGWDDPLSPLQHLAQTPETIGSETDWAEVGMGSAFTCARKTDGTLWCWGATSTNWTGLSIDPGQPSLMSSDTDWTSVKGGETGACGLRASTLYCWGNLPPWIGLVTITQVGTQTDWDVIDVAGGVCGLRNGELWCASGFGAQGTPEQVGSDNDWLTISVGGANLCGIRGASLPGEIWCSFSGTDNLYQVGNASDWMHVAAGKWTGVNDPVCGVKSDGTLWCWGTDVTSSQGPGPIAHTSPVQFGSESDYAYVAGGDGRHMCAVTTAKTVRCFGVDDVGMLGNAEAWSEELVQVNL